VDLNQLLHRHQVSLMQLDRAESPKERRAHSQFASDYAEKMRIVRDKLGAPHRRRASSDERAVEIDPSDNQIGHNACLIARVVLMPSEELTYTAVVSCDGEESSRRSFRTMQEAENHIQQKLPTPPPHATLYDREPDRSDAPEQA
jgi:hypothetical protein